MVSLPMETLSMVTRMAQEAPQKSLQEAIREVMHLPPQLTLRSVLQIAMATQ